MKKIISSKTDLVIHSYAITHFFGFSLIPLGLVVFRKTEAIGTGLLLFGFFLGIVCFLLCSLNRGACIVWVENGMVKRKGLFCGFYKECPVRAIQTVKIKHLPRDIGIGPFIFLIDDRTQPYKKFLRTRKDSYICFRKTKKNLEFLQTFWKGKVEE